MDYLMDNLFVVIINVVLTVFLLFLVKYLNFKELFLSPDSTIKTFFVSSLAYALLVHVTLVLLSIVILSILATKEDLFQTNPYWWFELAYTFSLYFSGMIITILLHHKVLFISYKKYKKEKEEKKLSDLWFGEGK